MMSEVRIVIILNFVEVVCIEIFGKCKVLDFKGGCFVLLYYCIFLGLFLIIRCCCEIFVIVCVICFELVGV